MRLNLGNGRSRMLASWDGSVKELRKLSISVTNGWGTEVFLKVVTDLLSSSKMCNGAFN